MTVKRETFRLTLNGGARVAWGRLENCALSALPLLVTGHTVHLRNLAHPATVLSVYADGNLRIAKPTEHGVICEMPEWGRQFLTVIHYTIGGGDELDGDSTE